jgi:lysophospholipase L1-like esterase
MTANILPAGCTQFFDNNGNPLVGGSVTFYIPNTSTLKNTWQDPEMTVLNTNPVILDARGEAKIWGNGVYRQVLKDSSGNLIYDVITTDPAYYANQSVDSIQQQLNGFISDLADTSDASKGDALVGVKQTATGGVPRTQHDRNQEDIRVSDFGSGDTAFSAVEALPPEDTAIFLPPGSFTTSIASTKTLIGPGSIVDSAGGVFNMQAWRSSKIVTHDIEGRVGDIRQLQAAISGGTVKVAIWGHSIAEGTNDIAYGDSWAGLFEQYCRDSFPGVTWNFVNYSISGKDVGEANSDTFVGANPPENPAINFYRTPGWQRDVPNYTLWPTGSVVGKTWYNHIRDESPDLVILNFGMNATQGDTNAWAATMKNLIINRIRTWTKVPSVAIMNDMLPTRKTEPFKSLNPILQAVADAARGVALELNTSLLDANRLCRAYREGYDIASTRTRFTIGAPDFSSWVVASGVKPSYSNDTFTWAANGSAVRPALNMNFIGSAAFVFNDVSTVFGMIWRANPNNLDQSYHLHIQPSVPQAVFYWNSVPIASTPIDPISVGSQVVVKIESIGAHHKVFINSKKVMDVFDYQGIVYGYYGLLMSGPGTAVRFRSQAGYARCIGFNEIPDEVMCGIGDELTNPNSLGGSGNHPSIIGHYTIYFGAIRPLIQAIQREISRWLNPVVFSSNVGTSIAAVSGDFVEAVINGTPGGACYAAGSGSGSSALYTGTAFNTISINSTSGQIINIALRVNGTTGLANTTLTIPATGIWLIEASGSASCNGSLIRNSLVAKATRVGG